MLVTGAYQGHSDEESEYVIYIYRCLKKCTPKKQQRCISMYQHISTYIQVPSQERYQAKIQGPYRWDKDMEMYASFLAEQLTISFHSTQPSKKKFPTSRWPLEIFGAQTGRL